MAELLVKDLLEGLSSEQVAADRLNMPVGQLVLDSRKITAGDTFVAMKGFQTDGRKFIDSALAKGAALVIAENIEKDKFADLLDRELPIIWIDDLQHQLSFLAANFYNRPSHMLKTIGVTGTNGKTSCSFLVAKTLQKLHFECFLLGTLGVGQSSNLQDCGNTTADAITMQKVLAEAVSSGAQFASMEVSSHGLDQGRAAAVKFNTAIFTNLTHDHLDYHGTMEKYGEAKRLLFLSPGLKNAVINMDDRFGRKLAEDDAITATKWLVTTKLPTSGSNLNRWIWAEEVVYSLDGLRAKIYTPWGSGQLDSPLIGKVNLSNLLIVIATLGSILKDVQPILVALQNVHSAPGRMQKFGGKDTPLAVVDYAHTPDALEQSLMALREHCVGIIWCVFGCGGDRDSAKRPLMARVAEKLANRVVVTLDNPRNESIEQIRDNIFDGFRKPEKVIYVEDRQQAIETSIAQAKPGDAVLIAGKGHEDYQIIGDVKSDLSDLDIVEKSIAEYQS